MIFSVQLQNKLWLVTLVANFNTTEQFLICYQFLVIINYWP